MYVIPSSPLSAATTLSAPALEADSVSSLAKRVSAYLARVVGALADFEDNLLCEDGFFAREELFEDQITNLRREFEQNRRAQILFARADAVGLLVAQLIAEPSAQVGRDLHSRRQQQFVFAAAVLLTSSTSMTTLRAHPHLVDRLWAFAERKAPLDAVQLQYFCRVAGCMLLAQPGEAEPPPMDAAALAPLLPRLLMHAYSEAVCLLIKCVLGLPASSGIPNAEPPLTKPVLPLRTVLAGEHSIVPHCVARLLRADESCENVAELLCTICGVVPDRPDAIELIGVLVPSFTPAFVSLLTASLGPAPAATAVRWTVAPAPPVSSRAVLCALRVITAALAMEERCAALADEQAAWLPSTLLEADSEPSASPARPASSRPFALLLVPRLGALRERLLSSRSLVQLKLAELLTTVIETAPTWMGPHLRQAKLLEACAQLYLQDDVNCGGQQDFLRQLVLRALRAILKGGQTSLQEALVCGTDLPRKMLHALRRPPKKAVAREHVALLYAALAQAAEENASLDSMLRSSSGRAWEALGATLAGAPLSYSPTSSSVGSSPPARSPTAYLSPEVAAPAMLFHPEDEEAFALELDHERAARSAESAARDADHQIARDEPALPPAGHDAENIDPNSPPTSSTKRGRPSSPSAPASPCAPHSPSPAAPFLEAVAAPSTPPPVPQASTHPGTPRPTEGGAAPHHPGTPRPEMSSPQHNGTPRPDAPPAHNGTPRPEGKAHNFVDLGSVRSAEDFSRDTPQPKVTRRTYLHRRAKEKSSPFGGIGTPSPMVAPADDDDDDDDDDGSRGSAHRGPGSSASWAAVVATSPSNAALSAEEPQCADAESEAPEDPSVMQLRSSVRTLCF